MIGYGAAEFEVDGTMNIMNTFNPCMMQIGEVYTIKFNIDDKYQDIKYGFKRVLICLKCGEIPEIEYDAEPEQCDCFFDYY